MVPLQKINTFIAFIETQILSSPEYPNHFSFTEEDRAFADEKSNEIAAQRQRCQDDVVERITKFQSERSPLNADSCKKSYDAALETGEEFKEKVDQEKELSAFLHCHWYRRDIQILRSLYHYKASPSNPTPFGRVASRLAGKYFEAHPFTNRDEEFNFYNRLFLTYKTANDLAWEVFKITGEIDRVAHTQYSLLSHRKSAVQIETSKRLERVKESYNHALDSFLAAVQKEQAAHHDPLEKIDEIYRDTFGAFSSEVHREQAAPHPDPLERVKKAYYDALEAFLSASNQLIKTLPDQFSKLKDTLMDFRFKFQSSLRNRHTTNIEIADRLKHPPTFPLIRSNSFENTPETGRLVHLLEKIDQLRVPLVNFKPLESETLKIIQLLEKLADQMDFFFNRNQFVLLENHKKTFQTKLSEIEKLIVDKSLLFFTQFAQQNIDPEIYPTILNMLKTKSRYQTAIKNIDMILGCKEPQMRIKVKYLKKGGEEKDHRLTKQKWEETEKSLRSSQNIQILEESWEGGNGAVLHLLFHHQEGIGTAHLDPLFDTSDSKKRIFESFKEIYEINNALMRSLLDPYADSEKLKYLCKFTHEENTKFLITMSRFPKTQALKDFKATIKRQKNAFEHFYHPHQKPSELAKASPTPNHYTPEGLLLELANADGKNLIDQIQEWYGKNDVPKVKRLIPHHAVKVISSYSGNKE